MSQAKVILLFSGKRKSGKDYICEKLKAKLDSTIIRISGPLKHLYAQNHKLDFQELLSDGPYKEIYRRDMIIWSDKVRNDDPGFFCKAACAEAEIKPIWIVSDIRRKTDIEWFKEEYGEKVRKIKVEANQDVREKRGWVFTEGVDDVASECDLDDYTDWDLIIKNNSDEDFQNGIVKIMTFIKPVLN